MKKTTIIALLTTLIVSVTAFAANADLTLPDKTAKPSGLIAFELDKLQNNTAYHLSCIVRSDRLSGKGHSDIRFITEGNIKVIFNKVDTSVNNGNATLQFPLNSLKAEGVTNQDTLLVQNLDKYDTIFIERCVASAV